MLILETRWAHPYRVGGNPGEFGVDFFGVAPAPFCVDSLLSLLAKRKSGREICVSSLLSGFCLSFFLHRFTSFFEAKVFHTFCTILPLLSLSGPSLRARSAATEEKTKMNDLARATVDLRRWTEKKLSEAGFEKIFRTKNWVRWSKLFCR